MGPNPSLDPQLLPPGQLDYFAAQQHPWIWMESKEWREIKEQVRVGETQQEVVGG